MVSRPPFYKIHGTAKAGACFPMRRHARDSSPGHARRAVLGFDRGFVGLRGILVALCGSVWPLCGPCVALAWPLRGPCVTSAPPSVRPEPKRQLRHHAPGGRTQPVTSNLLLGLQNLGGIPLIQPRVVVPVLSLEMLAEHLMEPIAQRDFTQVEQGIQALTQRDVPEVERHGPVAVTPQVVQVRRQALRRKGCLELRPGDRRARGGRCCLAAGACSLHGLPSLSRRQGTAGTGNRWRRCVVFHLQSPGYSSPSLQ